MSHPKLLALLLALAPGLVGIAHAGVMSQCAPNEVADSKLASFEPGVGDVRDRSGGAERAPAMVLAESTPAPAPDSGSQRADRGEAPAPAAAPAEPGGDYGKVRIRPSRWKALLPGALK